MAAFAPDVITHIGQLPITNTLVHTLVVDILLISSAYIIGKNLKKIPTGFQSLIEMLLDTFYKLTASMSTEKATKKIFPFVMSFFLFILISNFTALLPGVGSIGFFPEGMHSQANKVHAATNDTHEEVKENDHKENVSSDEPHAASPDDAHATTFVPLLRGATSDINVTLALAIISVLATHYLSITTTGFKDYITRYFSFNPVNLYVGMLELIAELTKIVSLSFRLFGNIFAGEVALHTVSNLFAFLFPLPFLILEGIVSVVQALVFSILTMVFMSILTTPHHAAHDEAHAHVDPSLKHIKEGKEEVIHT